MKVKNWEQFQHFKDRRPPWIKLYHDLLDDMDYHNLDAEAAKYLVLIWLVASEDCGNLPDITKLAFKLRITEQKCKSLIDKLNHYIETEGYQDDINVISERYQDDSVEKRREREEKEKKRTAKAARFNPLEAVLKLGVSESVATDFVNHRKKLRAELTQTALDMIEKEAILAGVSAEIAMQECLNRGWRGFKASWYSDTADKSSKPYDFSGAL